MSVSEQSKTPRESVTIDKLVAAAAKLFREQGYAATTTRQLSSDLGIQRASLYHHIDSKEDLLYEVSSRSLDRIVAAGRRAVATALPEHQLRDLITAHLDVALRDQDLHATMLIELKHLSVERRRRVVEKRDQYETIVRELISDEQRAGRVRTDVTAQDLTLALLNLLNWTIFWYRPGGPSTREHLAQIYATIFIDGAGSGEKL